MKKLYKYILFALVLFCLLALPFLSVAQGTPEADSVCLPTARLARIADTIAYLRQYQRYAITADSAFSECKRFSTALLQKNDALALQRDGAVKSAEALAYQLGLEKSISQQWQQVATETDLKLQKAKRSRRTWAGLFGGAAGAGLIVGLLIALL